MTVSIMKELFAKHGVTEPVHTSSGLQFTNALFAEFATQWKYDCNTNIPRNPRSHGQTEDAKKIVKGLLTHAVLGSGSILSPPSVLQHTHQCISVLPCRTSVPLGIRHHSTIAFTEY